MQLPADIINYVSYGMAGAAILLVLIGSRMRTVERRVACLCIAGLLATCLAVIVLNRQFQTAPENLIALLLAALGICARIYDSSRTFRSVSGSLRHMGNLYLLSGFICLISHRTGFPLLLWIIPLVLFAAGYFYFRRRRGVANLLKTLAMLISLAFIASMVYDIYEGGTPGLRRRQQFARSLLPDIVKPSLVDKLTALNEKNLSLESEKKRLTGELLRLKTDYATLDSRITSESARLKELEEKQAEASAQIAKLTVEKKELLAQINSEKDARVAAEGKAKELEGARNVAKDSFTSIEQKINTAAEDLEKAVAERDQLKIELARLKSSTPPGTRTLNLEPQEIAELKKRIEQKETERAELGRKVLQLENTIANVRAALGSTIEPTPLMKGK